MRLFFVVSYITSLKHQSRKRNAAVNEPALFAYDSINVSYEGVEISISMRYSQGNGFNTSLSECSNDWGGRGYDDSVPGEVTKTTPSGDRIT